MHTVAGSNVVDNRPLVAVGPRVPHKIDRVSGIDVGIESTCRCALVAVDVCAAESSGLDETIVLVQCIPASGLGPAVGRAVEPDGVRTGGGFAVDDEFCDKAVRGGSVEEKGESTEERCRGVHFGGEKRK